jgi:hypothetical protein
LRGNRDNPVVREAFFPSGTQPLAVEPAKPDDGSAVSAIARRHEGPEAAGLLERWLAEAPETFSVVRDRDGAVAGFFALFTADMLRPSLVAGDPVLEAWAQDLLDHPLPKGQRALGLRRWLDADRGELPCASQAACWLDVKRAYMALRPALRRMYVVVQRFPRTGPSSRSSASVRWPTGALSSTAPNTQPDSRGWSRSCSPEARSRRSRP